MLPPEADVDDGLQLEHDGRRLHGRRCRSAPGFCSVSFPALQSTRPDLVTELRNNSGKLSGGRGAARFRTSLVTAQIALSMALLISAGLFIKSLRNISRVDLGVTIDNMVTFGISPSLSGYDTTRAKALYARVEEELAALPGVTGVTAAMVPMLAGNNWGQGVSVEGFKKDPDTDDGSRFNGGRPELLQGARRADPLRARFHAEPTTRAPSASRS